MVDVGWKSESERVAKAKALVAVGETAAKLIAENALKKGDVLATARIAGIMAAKRTADLIPLCHPITLTKVAVELSLNTTARQVTIVAEVKCFGKTGVEMEALTAASVAALTVYDMCKGVATPEELYISRVELLQKSGGTKSNYTRKAIGENEVVH